MTSIRSPNNINAWQPLSCTNKTNVLESRALAGVELLGGLNAHCLQELRDIVMNIVIICYTRQLKSWNKGSFHNIYIELKTQNISKLTRDRIIELCTFIFVTYIFSTENREAKRQFRKCFCLPLVEKWCPDARHNGPCLGIRTCIDYGSEGN